jgi:uncharacterized membrane protein
MITLDAIYALAGLLFLGVAVAVGLDPRQQRGLSAAGFYGLLAISFILGGQLGDAANGALVLGLVALAAGGALEGRAGDGGGARTDLHPAPAWKLFVPALTIPLVALVASLLLPQIRIGGGPLLSPTAKSLPAMAGLALGVLVALGLAMTLLRRPLADPVQSARGLLQAVGWAALLPQLLAALGAVFALSGVGTAVSHLAATALPSPDRFSVVLVYCVGMALFTVVMGNAFAAFPVMTAGVGLPLIVGRYHGDPAIMGAIGMLSGFCGTLVTPMAANFNLVPAALLQLRDRYGVIRAQAPTAALLLAGNTALMYFLVFPKP